MLLSAAVRRVVLPALLLAALVLPGRALAQTNPVEPYYAATTRADVPLKSGDMDGYYPVALLPAGQVLWIDAEGAGWARVAYPPGLSVYVRADEVREEPGGRSVVLTKVSALKSRNATAGFAQSWQRAVPRNEEPAIGTRLVVIEAIVGPDGTTIGYEVEPPAVVRGYVKAEALRAATDAEVQAYLATAPKPGDEPAAEDEPVVEEPVVEEPVVDEPPADEPADEPAANPADDQANPAEDGGVLEPIVPLGETPVRTQREPDSGQPEGPGDESPVVIDQTPADTTPESRLVGTLTHLAELFAQVQSQNSDTAELDELAAEFRRAISAQGNDVIGERIRTALGQRLQLVETRIAARDLRRGLRAKREAIDATYASVAGRVRELEATRGYQFVGRLVRSSVYDGVRLPLMYRIVSVNESVPRTLGYIVPDESMDITGKLGEIVGVLGTSQLDTALNLRLVTPTRVDVLAAEGLGLPTPAEPGA